jgi:VCBS repeat-containing protein
MDNTAPTLTNLTITDLVDTSGGSGNFKFTTEATDESGILSIVLYFDQPLTYGFSANSATPNGTWPLVITNGPWVNDSSYKTISIFNTNENGTYTITRVEVRDWAGNNASYDTQALLDMGFDTEFVVNISATISGLSDQGEVLTAIATVAQLDGADNITYQWLRGGENIDLATSATYTLANDDIGAEISVVTSYLNDNGIEQHAESSSMSVPEQNVDSYFQDSKVYVAFKLDNWTTGVNSISVQLTFNTDDFEYGSARLSGGGSSSTQTSLSSMGSTGTLSISGSFLNGLSEGIILLDFVPKSTNESVFSGTLDRYIKNGDVDNSRLYDVTVPNINDTPVVASAIADATATEDSLYTYDASANFSDADIDDSITYTATLSDDSSLPDWISVNSSTGVLSGTPANAGVGATAVKVTATDSQSTSVSDTYTLTVSNTNDAAIITAADSSITKGVATTVTSTATHTDIDANNDANVFTPVSTTSSTYGSYSVTTGGVWTYTLDNSNTTIQALVLGESTTDSITVTAEDVTTEAITITINGANDAAKLLSSYSTSPANIIDNLTIELWKESTQVGGDIAITKGEVLVDSTTDFDQVRISQSDAFDTSLAINVFDVLLTVESIVGISTLTGSARQAADVNNDSDVNVFDVLAMVEHIVGVSSIDHFDMVNSSGNRITQLTSITSGDVPEYHLVMNGDVNMDGAFNEGYITTVDIV